jgi:hypothetical protein
MLLVFVLSDKTFGANHLLLVVVTATSWKTFLQMSRTDSQVFDKLKIEGDSEQGSE